MVCMCLHLARRKIPPIYYTTFCGHLLDYEQHPSTSVGVVVVGEGLGREYDCFSCMPLPTSKQEIVPQGQR